MVTIELEPYEIADIYDALAWSGSKNGWLASVTKKNPVAAEGHKLRFDRAYKTYQKMIKILVSLKFEGPGAQ